MYCKLSGLDISLGMCSHARGATDQTSNVKRKPLSVCWGSPRPAFMCSVDCIFSGKLFFALPSPPRLNGRNAPATFAPRLHTPRPRFFLRRKPCNSTSAASCARSAHHLCAGCSSRFPCSPRFRRGSTPISAVSLFARTSVAPPRRVSRCRSRASYAQFPHLSPPDAFSPETSAAPSRLPVSLQITSAPPRAHLGSKC